MRALVTGSAGFVGRHMVKELLHRGYEVHRVDLKHVDVDVKIEHYHYQEDAREFFYTSKSQYDLVVHCAYMVGGREMIDGFAPAMINNVMLDSMMFDWAIRTEQKAVLYFSSSAAYPIHLQGWGMPTYQLHEEDINDQRLTGTPDARYGWAKLTGEKLAEAASQAGLRVHIVRPFSGYGEDQDTAYPFPSFIDRALRLDNPFEVWGDGTQRRDWIHIDDVVNGALAIVDADMREPVNLGTGIGHSMIELIRTICANVEIDAIHGYHPDIQTHPEKPVGVMNRVASTSRLNEFYDPKVSLRSGILRALAYRQKLMEK